MTHKHPGKTPAQRRALNEIGGGNNCPAMTQATKNALLAAGLIQKCGRQKIEIKKVGAGLSVVHVDMFAMPIPVHIRWCDAVSGEVDGLETAK